MRADDVSCASADEQESCRHFPLGIAAGVLAGPAVDERANARIEGDEVVADKQCGPVFLLVGNGKEHGDTDDGWDAEADEDGRLPLVSCCQIGTTERGDHLHGPERHVKEDSGEAIEAERLDDQRTEG